MRLIDRGVVNVTCTTSQQCGSHGQCSSTLFICECNKGYTTNNYTQPCEYEQKSKVTAICLSIFFGGFGADWFYLNAGYSGYIVGGVFKILILGGGGIWWIVDIFRIGFNVFLDGQGIPLV
ncbi:hypothetical protein I4U23_020075 [Adineta vaga]|nr:hypothetical protein I4U23_020075 [Adineta vaga]